MSATPDTQPPEAVSDLPSSRTMVWWVLHSEEELTFGGVVEATDASEDTVARSLRDLLEVGVVDRDVTSSDDPSVPVYRLSD